MIERAILLSAGQGSRLLPLTAQMPKCLIELSGRSLIAWQVEMLARGGVRRIDVVTGFQADLVAEHLAAIADPRVEIVTWFNPFYKVADNLGSCWIARAAMVDDFLILNGDTLVSEEVVAAVQAGAGAGRHQSPIAVTIDVKPAYDADDMKVSRASDGRLLRIGKTLTKVESNAESIGFIALRGAGGALFRDAVRQWMRTPEGVQHWYLKVIDALAATGQVGTCAIDALGPQPVWAEVDYLNDIEIATALTNAWTQG